MEIPSPCRCWRGEASGRHAQVSDQRRRRGCRKHVRDPGPDVPGGHSRDVPGDPERRSCELPASQRELVEAKRGFVLEPASGGGNFAEHRSSLALEHLLVDSRLVDEVVEQHRRLVCDSLRRDRVDVGVVARGVGVVVSAEPLELIGDGRSARARSVAPRLQENVFREVRESAAMVRVGRRAVRKRNAYDRRLLGRRFRLDNDGALPHLSGAAARTPSFSTRNSEPSSGRTAPTWTPDVLHGNGPDALRR